MDFHSGLHSTTLLRQGDSEEGEDHQNEHTHNKNNSGQIPELFSNEKSQEKEEEQLIKIITVEYEEAYKVLQRIYIYYYYISLQHSDA